MDELRQQVKALTDSVKTLATTSERSADNDRSLESTEQHNRRIGGTIADRGRFGITITGDRSESAFAISD